MMYHVLVNGKLLWKNLSRRKAMEIFDIAQVLCPDDEVSVLMTKDTEVN